MERVGILIISYGSRALAMVDAFSRNNKYDIEFYAACKQRDPYLAKVAKEQVVIPNLAVDEISGFANKHKTHIDFGIVGPEGPIINGVADELESNLGIPMICPTQEYALEASKIRQRLLLEEVVPTANPEFRVFDSKNYQNDDETLIDFKNWVNTLGGVSQCVIKPDRPGFGKGVGVGGEHFFTLDEAWAHFLTLYGMETKERVIVEERVAGEEFSLQFFSDGNRILPTPAVRDYKRAFDGDRGPNTGGMGSYKDTEYLLPFMEQKDLDDGLKIGEKLFKKLRGDSKNSGLKGIPFYMAYICTNNGVKLLEINSRPGDPEIQNLLPVLEDDFVDTCYAILNGTLQHLNFHSLATVVTYAVPLTYGGYRREFSGSAQTNLSYTYQLSEKYGDRMRVYPGSMEIREDGMTYALGSRTVCIVGISESIPGARVISLDGIRSIDGPLRNREDIASEDHINNSINHIKELRGH